MGRLGRRFQSGLADVFVSLCVVDTSDELNSCGGCIFRDAHAVDCEALPNVAVGGVVCKKGRCEISDCAQGFRLRDGVCV